MLIFLCFHKVEASPNDSIYSIQLDKFRYYLALLRRSGSPIIDPRDLSVESHTPPRGVVLTFDDATIDHFTLVLPALAEAGLRALFYVPTGKLDKESYLSCEQLRLIAAAGNTVGSHAHSHRSLNSMLYSRMIWEIERSRFILTGILGEPPVHFAPPGGFYSAAVRDAARRLGFRFFRTSRWGYNRPVDFQRIEIIPVNGFVSGALLGRVLAGEGEIVLKTVYVVKQITKRFMRRMLYGSFRRTTLSLLYRFGAMNAGSTTVDCPRS